jgi:hypothetical protein
MTVSDSASRENTTVVSLARAPEKVTDRIGRLQREARVLAADHAQEFAAQMRDMARGAGEIAKGGEAYPPGVRELVGRLAASLEMNANSIQAILHQVGPRD